MPEVPRNKGDFLQAGTVHIVPKIDGSFLSVDGMVDFDIELVQADFPVLYAAIGDTYSDGGTPGGSFRTPKLSDWDLTDPAGGLHKYMIRF